ncbi:hypothetical protein [Pendulispora albinea]|uniref:Uncharacterized protein n=1 Tax=Pendulispora albinea TaxID=2741071 RepID=A0ABZ2LX21_9BACT
MSEARDQSINTIVLDLLEQAVGLNDRRERLRRYTTWTESELHEFEGSLDAQRTIDDKAWR